MNYEAKLMNDFVQKIRNNRETILIGEIAAMLHDIGKCHPDFIKSKSIEKFEENLCNHASDIEEILCDELIKLIKSNSFKIEIKNFQIDIFSIIKEHHNPKNTNYLIKLIQSCDGLDSADDKGIVREKQSVNDTIISSPFGAKKEIIDLECLEYKLHNLEPKLIEIFQDYKSEKLECFRNKIIEYAKETFSHALGETRIPANDVTLWDHSRSTGTLFKTILCSLVLGEKPDSNDLKWRILGFCWDGMGFINKGKKILDILRRREIISEIEKILEQRFEYKIPIGNVIYKDINGIYFTFPSLSDEKSKNLAKECLYYKENSNEENIVEIIWNRSGNEIWPFFALSRASRTLTVLSNELKFASEKRKIPKISPILFIENSSCSNDSREKFEIENHINLQALLGNRMQKLKKNNRDVKVDICSACQIRVKEGKEELCDVCNDRRKGRLEDWLFNKDKKDTIWLDEVADRNNRIALLTLGFDLEKWLDGTMIGTIYSQTFKDCMSNVDSNKKVKNILKDRKIKHTKDSYKNAVEIAKWITFNPDKSEVDVLLKCFMEKGRVENIPKCELVQDPQKMLIYFFTQNPSPARLYRIWNETEEFFDTVLENIKREIYSIKCQRIKFQIGNKNLKSILKNKLKDSKTYIIKIKGLEPENLCVLYDKSHGFISIESLDKFKSKDKSGLRSIYSIIDNLEKNGFYHIAEENESEKNLLEGKEPVKVNINIEKDIEEYYPLIEITKSPVLMQLIVPAIDSIKILKSIRALYDKKFKKVAGKLPLSAGLFVTKRKFPLYVLLDASRRFVEGCKSEETEKVDCNWMNIVDSEHDKNYKYYSFYPIKKLSKYEKYSLDNLEQISAGKKYELYPGYFDFELLLGTTDRYRINYSKRRYKEEKDNKKIKRLGSEYKLLSSRPFYFHQILDMVNLWNHLVNNISISKINNLEGIITSKLKEYENVKEADKEDIIEKFIEATLKNTFGSNWDSLGKEEQYKIINSALSGFLLDTIIFFRHILKIKEVV